MATERLQVPHANEPIKPIYVLDKGQPMPLWPTEINGVVVYTPTAEKTQELKERFAAMVPPLEPKPASRLRLPSFAGRWLGRK
jgi:hypothetical protein